MPKIKLEIVTAEKQIYSEDVDMVVAPGVEGYLGILPHHTPLMTMLQAGELRVKKEGQEICMVITGGFLEVRPDKVVILADAAERVEEIDVCRAEAAKKRAEERLKAKAPDIDVARAQAALSRAIVRIKVTERRRRQLAERR